MKQPDVNMIRFFCAVALLIFGRKPTDIPYTAKEACDVIDKMASSYDLEEEL